MNLRDDGKGTHPSFKRRIGIGGNPLLAVLWALGEIGGEVLC